MSKLRRRRAFRARRVDHYRSVNITVGGATEKNILENPKTGARYIAKLGRRHNDLEVMTEYVIYLIGRSLGVNVADARIAEYRGRLRFLSRYFLDDTMAEELVHGVQLFSDLYDERTVRAVLGNEATEQAFFTVQAVQAAFGAHYIQYGVGVESDLFDGFVSMLTHDALIGVQDRHHENWGLIVRRDRASAPPRFSPLYDSARGLFGNAPDAHIGRYLKTEAMPEIETYIGRSRPLIGFEGLAPAQGRKHLSHDRLLTAVYRDFPQTRESILGILNAFDTAKVRVAMTRLEPLCGSRRRSLILRCLKRRHQTLLRALSSASKTAPKRV